MILTSFTKLVMADGEEPTGNPRQVSTLDHLLWISTNPSSWGDDFVQTGNINASATSDWNFGDGFSPIGNPGTFFTGTYDGDGYIIDSLTINRGITDYVGFFGSLSGATVSNLGFTNANITAASGVGVIAGISINATIQNCYSSGTVNGNDYCGGLIAFSNNSTIRSSYSSVSVNGNNYCGVFLGYNFGGSVIQNSYSSHSVSGIGYIGGFVGYNDSGCTLKNSYSLSSVNGIAYVGGFVGQNENGGTLQNCYSTGAVSASAFVGGLVGVNNSGTILHSFWDTLTSGQSISFGGTGKSTLEMQTQSTFTDAGWDFVGETLNGTNDDWFIKSDRNNGYPFLEWQYPIKPALSAEEVTSITPTSSLVHASITDFGMSQPTQHGICWNTFGNPTLSDEFTEEGSPADTGSFTSSMTGLTGNTTYYVRAYATNSYGTDYSNEVSFTIYSFSKGEGTSENPFQIESLSDLEKLQYTTYYWDSYFIQTQDIEASATSGWNSGDGFSPVGDSTTQFTGTYDGDGHTISGLKIKRDSASTIGMFGYTLGSNIANLGLIDVDITGKNIVGGLVGLCHSGSSVLDCFVSGTINGIGGVGGLLGSNNNASSIENCYSSANVNGELYVGGLIGASNNSVIQNCFAMGNVVGNAYSGGLIGANSTNIIQSCYSTGSVNGSINIGGLVGYNYQSSVENSYSMASVIGVGNVGGLLGNNFDASTVENSYSCGSVIGSVTVGGLVGFNDASSVSNSFWDTETSGQSSSAGGTGKSTAAMQTLGMYSDTDTVGLNTAWDFVGDPNDDAATNDYWNFNDIIGGYPFLTWQTSQMHNVPAGNTDAYNFAASGVAVQFTTGNTGAIELNIVRTDAEPNVFGSLPGLVQNLSPRYWSATIISGSANGTYDITFDITGLDGVVDCYTLKVLKRNDSSSDWENAETLGGVLDFSGCPNTLIVRGLTGFSDFVIGGGADNPLPVELAGFSGVSTSNGVELSWSTQSETNNAGFVVLRNGIEIASYKTREALEGHGSTSNKQTYAYIDGDVSLNETYTYELISVDYSGARHSYSQTVEAKVVEAITSGKPIEYALEQNYPNPFNPSTTITYTMKKPGVATLKVYDMLGRLVIEQTKASVKGENQINFNGSNLTSGVYYYQLNAEGFSKTLKMMLVK